jgi:hypothetical protein
LLFLPLAESIQPTSDVLCVHIQRQSAACVPHQFLDRLYPHDECRFLGEQLRIGFRIHLSRLYKRLP